MRVLPIDDRRLFEPAHLVEPVRLPGVQGQHIGGGPFEGREVVHHDDVEFGAAETHVRRGAEFDIGRRPDGLLEKAIAAAGEQHLDRLRQQADHRRLVINRQRVVHHELQGEEAVHTLIDDENLRQTFARRQRHCFEIHRLAIEGELQPRTQRIARDVGDVGEDGPLRRIVRVGPHIHGRDAGVLRTGTDAVINQRQRFALKAFGKRKSTIAEQVNLGVVLILHQRLGEPERFVEAGDGVGWRRPLDRAAQGGLLAGGGLFDLRAGPSLEHDHLVAFTQAVDEFHRLGAGRLEPVRLHVGGLHGSRGIEHEHAEPALFGIAGEVRAGEREDHEDQHQQLEQQEPVLAQLLEGRVGLVFGEELLPEQRARDELHHPLAFEEVKHHHHRQRQREPESGGFEKVHVNPRFQLP